MADVTGKTPGRGLLDSLGLGKLFGAPPKAGPGTGLVGEPAEPAAQRVFKERLAALNPEQRRAYEDFVGRMPVYQDDPAITDYADQIVLPAVEVAYSTDHGKKENNEDGVFVDPLLDIGVVADGVSHGGKGRIATQALLRAIRQWTTPEQAGMLQGELRTRSVKNTPENRLKLIGHKAHAAVREALGPDAEGGSVVAGTLIEGNKLYSFVLGDAMNLVIRNEKVVFCSKPTSRLQRFVDIYNVPPKDLKAKLSEYLATTPIEKIRSELNYLARTDLERIKRIIWVDPVKVLGYDDADVSVEEFELQPDDTVISVTDGILAPLGLRVIPTKKDKKTDRWVFDPAYDSMRAFSKLLDPLSELGHLVGRNAEETRNNILKLFQPGGRGAGGADHKTILVRRQAVPVLPRHLDADRTEVTSFTPTSRSAPHLEPIGPGYAEEKTPVDEARRGRAKLPVLVEVEEEEPGPAPLPPDPTWASEPVRVVPPPLPPLPTWQPAPPRAELSPLPSVEHTSVSAELRSKRLQEHDLRYMQKNEQAADALLWEIWSLEDNLAALEGRVKLDRPWAEKIPVRKNYLLEAMDQFDQAWPELKASYATMVQNKDWQNAFENLEAQQEGQSQQVEQSYILAWLEADFESLKGRVFELVDDRGTQKMQVTEVFPPNDPDTPNIVVMLALGRDGKPLKRMALPAQQWLRKLETEQVDLHVSHKLEEVDALLDAAEQSIWSVRIWFKAGNYALKLDQGRFRGTVFEPVYRELQAALAKYPERFEPESMEEVGDFMLWVDSIENLQERIQDLTQPKK